MRNLIIGSLTGSVAAFAIMAAIDDSQEYIDGLNRVKTMAIETQQIISRKENALAKQSSALENLVAELKDQMNTVKSELSDLRSDQATFRIEREKSSRFYLLRSVPSTNRSDRLRIIRLLPQKSPTMKSI